MYTLFKMDHPIYFNLEECLLQDKLSELLNLLDIDNSKSIQLSKLMWLISI